MPKTQAGEHVVANMKKEYGPEKGKQVFYAKANKEGKGSKFFHMAHGKNAEAWAQGFIDKCAEQGVDPDELVKMSQAALIPEVMPKITSLMATAKPMQAGGFLAKLKAMMMRNPKTTAGLALGGAGLAGGVAGSGLGAAGERAKFNNQGILQRLQQALMGR